MAGGAVMGAATKAVGIWLTHKNDSHKRMMELLAGKEDSIRSAREFQTPGASFGRRFITIMSFCLLAFLVVAPAFMSVQTNVPIESWIPWVSFDYESMQGIVAYEVLMEILVATTSFYMGSATMGGG
jgi:hypothetical protein